MNYITIIFNKPLGSDNFIFIRDKYLKQASRTGKKLKIVTPNGTHYTTPAKWRQGAKHMDQEFRIPGKPMHLVGNYATPNESSDQTLNDLTVDNSMKMKAFDLLKAKYGTNGNPFR